jgi:hypothetical protein
MVSVLFVVSGLDYYYVMMAEPLSIRGVLEAKQKARHDAASFVLCHSVLGKLKQYSPFPRRLGELGEVHANKHCCSFTDWALQCKKSLGISVDLQR